LTGNGICAVAAGVLAQLAADQVQLPYQHKSTCFTSTKVQILTPEDQLGDIGPFQLAIMLTALGTQFTCFTST
jgi:hypothetical protein